MPQPAGPGIGSSLRAGGPQGAQVSVQCCGPLRATVIAWIATGGHQVRDRIPFVRIIRTEDLQDWREPAVFHDSFRGWVMAMFATYRLGGHEVWHSARLPDELEGDAGEIALGCFHSHGDGSATKSGHRFALPLPPLWVSGCRRDDCPHCR